MLSALAYDYPIMQSDKVHYERRLKNPSFFFFFLLLLELRIQNVQPKLFIYLFVTGDYNEK